jgi:hypothetical protein
VLYSRKPPGASSCGMWGKKARSRNLVCSNGTCACMIHGLPDWQLVGRQCCNTESAVPIYAVHPSKWADGSNQLHNTYSSSPLAGLCLKFKDGDDDDDGYQPHRTHSTRCQVPG